MKNVPAFVNTTSVLLMAATAVLTAAQLLYPNTFFLIAAIAVGTACYHTVSRGIIGPAVTRFQSRLNPAAFWFRPHRFEPKLYGLLRVKVWSKKLPTYTPDAFSLRTAAPESILLSSCNAELVHEVCMLTGFLPLVMAVFVGAFWVFFITSVVTAVADLLFVITLRYHRGRVIRILRKKEAKVL